MKDPADENRLSRIVTNWDELFAAHESSGKYDASTTARNEILLRYASCAYHYILGATRDLHVAEDLTQEFALRFARGDFKNVDPAKGRFRDYLKRSLRNLVTDYFRKRPDRQLTESVADQIPTHLELSQLDSLEDDFQRRWRRQILRHAWGALKEFETERDNAYYLVLHLRSQDPKLTSQELAVKVSKLRESDVTADWVRQKLHRARGKFAELLIQEVRRSLVSSDEESIRIELRSLGLEKYVS